MSVSKELKTAIKRDWLHEFSQLTAYTQTRFYKISGPIIYGIEIIKSSWDDIYRPYFAIYPLWKEDVKDCMDHPYKFMALRNRKGLQFDIPYNKQDEYIGEAIKCMREQILVSLEGDVFIKNLFRIIDKNTLSHDSYEFIQAYLLKLHLLLYLKCDKEMKKLLKEIASERKKLINSYFEHFYGDFDIWFQNLQESLSNRDVFIQRVELNKQDKKLKKMLVSKIIL